MSISVPTQSLALSYPQTIEDYVADNQLTEALNQLQDLVINLAPHLKDTVLTLRRRYAQFRQDKLNNLAEPNEADVIARTLLELVAEAEKGPTVAPKYAVLNVDTAPSLPAQPNPARETPDYSKKDPEPRHPRDQMETTDEQLRGYWSLYRDSRPPDDTVAVDCIKISKRLGGRSSFRLEELSFRLSTGQITGIVGRNASGKTTLLNIVRAEMISDTGNVRYPLLTTTGNSWPHIKRQIGYVPQIPEGWSGQLKTNLHFTAAVHGTTGRRNRDLIDWHLQRYGLDHYQYYTWSKLSGGYRMRYELVRVLISRPRLLVLDEPLASLDVVARQEFLKNLRAIAYSLAEPVPIIITSQHLYEIESIADQMIILDDGKCLFCGSLNQMEAESTTRVYELNIRADSGHVQT